MLAYPQQADRDWQQATTRDDRLREADLAASALVLPQPRPRPSEPTAERPATG